MKKVKDKFSAWRIYKGDKDDKAFTKSQSKSKALDKAKGEKIDRSTKKGRYQNMLRIGADADNHFQKN